MTLVSLTSKQIWPHVLVTLHLKPEKIILVHTPDFGESKGPAERLKRLIGKHTDIFGSPHVSTLEVPHDDFAAIGMRLDGIIDEPGKTMFNITGGNKLMSTAAFEKARLLRCPAIYLERGNILVEFRYQGEMRSVTASKLDSSICNALDAADLCECQSGEAKLAGRGERLTLNEKGKTVSLKHIETLIKQATTLRKSSIDPKKWLNIEVFQHRESNKGDIMEYAVAVVLLKLGIPVVYRSLEFIPIKEKSDRFKEGELDLVFNHNGSLWIVDCKDKTRQQDIYDQTVTSLVKEGISQQRAIDLLKELQMEREQKDKKVLREDLQQIMEVGGIQGKVIAVRATGLQPHDENYARSRGERISIVYKNEMVTKLETLLFPNRRPDKNQLADLAKTFGG